VTFCRDDWLSTRSQRVSLGLLFAAPGFSNPEWRQTMPSRSEFGLAPDEHEERRARRRFESDDESGARPLPRDPTSWEYTDYDDEPVDLPRSRAGLFGVGVGVGIAALAVAGGLYLGGYLDRATLNPAQEPLPLATDSSRFDEWSNDEALASARVAERNFSLAAASIATEIESPDIQVLEEDLRAPHPVPTNPVPASPEPDQANPRPVQPELKAPQMPLAPGESVPEREQLPAPAQPTAPAEMAPPDNPY
jgi:hypothetical protein